MAKVLPITYTLLSAFKTCPKKYEGQYITKEVQFTSSPATEHGNLLHKSIEDYLNSNGSTSFPSEVVYGKPYAEWVMREASKPDRELFVEKSLAIKESFEATTWWDAPWVRGKADVVIVDHRHKRVVVVDWKTGKPYGSENLQAQVLGLCASITYGYRTVDCMWTYIHPEKDNSKKGLVSVEHNRLEIARPYTACSQLFSDIAKYVDACNKDTFVANPNGLCKAYCDVFSCPHNGRKKA